MTDRELMQMALDALDSDNPHIQVGAAISLRYRLDQPDEWIELTVEEGAEIWADYHDIDWKRTVPPKEIVKRISDKLKEKNK